MKLSAKAEYGCIAVIELAAKYGAGQPSRVKAFADAQGIPIRFLVQILLQLKGAGVVASIRGATGGYQLTRPPEKISLGEIISAIDPPQHLCKKSSTHASRATLALRSVWQEIQAEEQRLLERVNLADLLRKIQEPGELSYQI
jgi:Rrf2 family protein